jgi:hypothetical protein
MVYYRPESTQQRTAYETPKWLMSTQMPCRTPILLDILRYASNAIIIHAMCCNETSDVVIAEMKKSEA